MQKWKIIIYSALILGSVSLQAQAETQAPVSNNSTKSDGQNELPAPVQDHMIEMMQDDFSFQNQKRSLSNQLELEQLRGAIQKAKGISVTAPVPAAEIPADTAEKRPEEHNVTESIALPKVLLVSDIGGISRVAITSNNVVKLVKLNERFSLEGHSFIVSNSGRNMPTVKEVTP